MFFLAMCGYINDQKYCCMQHGIYRTHYCHFYATATPSDRIYISGCVAWIMAHTQVSMNVRHAKDVIIALCWYINDLKH